MSIINKTPKIYELLEKLYARNETYFNRFVTLLNGNNEPFVARSIYSRASAPKISDADEGVTKVRIVFNTVNATIRYGYLVKDKEFCFVVVFDSINDNQLELFEIDLEKEKYEQYSGENLTILELRYTCTAISSGGGGGGPTKYLRDATKDETKKILSIEKSSGDMLEIPYGGGGESEPTYIIQVEWQGEPEAKIVSPNYYKELKDYYDTHNNTLPKIILDIVDIMKVNNVMYSLDKDQFMLGFHVALKEGDDPANNLGAIIVMDEKEQEAAVQTWEDSGGGGEPADYLKSIKKDEGSQVIIVTTNKGDEVQFPYGGGGSTEPTFVVTLTLGGTQSEPTATITSRNIYNDLIKFKDTYGFYPKVKGQIDLSALKQGDLEFNIKTFSTYSSNIVLRSELINGNVPGAYWFVLEAVDLEFGEEDKDKYAYLHIIQPTKGGSSKNIVVEGQSPYIDVIANETETEKKFTVYLNNAVVTPVVEKDSTAMVTSGGVFNAIQGIKTESAIVITLNDNPAFNSEEDIVLADNIIDINGNKIDVKEISAGRTVLITDLNVPDRWYSGVGTFYRIETKKVSLEGYQKENDDRISGDDKNVVNNINDLKTKTDTLIPFIVSTKSQVSERSYIVPKLTVTEVTNLYLARQSGKSCLVDFEPIDGLHIKLNLINSNDNATEKAVRFIYNDVMVLTYTLVENEGVQSVEISSSLFGQGTESPIKDVQRNGTTVVDDKGVANIKVTNEYNLFANYQYSTEKPDEFELQFASSGIADTYNKLLAEFAPTYQVVDQKNPIVNLIVRNVLYDNPPDTYLRAYSVHLSKNDYGDVINCHFRMPKEAFTDYAAITNYRNKPMDEGYEYIIQIAKNQQGMVEISGFGAIVKRANYYEFTINEATLDEDEQKQIPLITYDMYQAIYELANSGANVKIRYNDSNANIHALYNVEVNQNNATVVYPIIDNGPSIYVRVRNNYVIRYFHRGTDVVAQIEPTVGHMFKHVVSFDIGSEEVTIDGQKYMASIASFSILTDHAESINDANAVIKNRNKVLPGSYIVLQNKDSQEHEQLMCYYDGTEELVGDKASYIWLGYYKDNQYQWIEFNLYWLKNVNDIKVDLAGAEHVY